MYGIDPKFIDTILHVDCVEGMRRLPDSCIPLTVTSPPYDDIREYDGHAFDFEAVAGELWRVTTAGGVVVWVVGEQVKNGTETCTSSVQKLHFKKIGFRVATMIIETTRVRFPEKVRYPSQFDYAFVLSKGRARHFHAICDKENNWPGQKFKWKHRGRNGDIVTRTHCGDKYVKQFGSRTNVWRCNVGWMKTTPDRDAYRHPALMPETLAEDLIISWSRPGDLVLDPMCGAATTGKMAMLRHRRYLGMEVCEEYVRLARQRLARAKLEQRRRLDAMFFGDEIENRPGGKANGKEFDETTADDVPHTRCPFCDRRVPI
jgi:site-specific DNA-methyltransferase (adenine-specific)